MNLDIKNLEDQDMKQLVKSLELVSARIFDSVVGKPARGLQHSRNAAALLPVGGLPRRRHHKRREEEGGLYPDELAQNIGVTPATIISLALTLHREGRIKITEIKAEPASGEHRDLRLHEGLSADNNRRRRLPRHGTTAEDRRPR
ncbi:MAG: hypothetical protein ACLUEQ_06985 [Cloacibacillus evryensis]